MKTPSYRLTNVLGLLACVAAILFAVLILQGTLNLEPCPLCIVDRVIIMTLALVFLVAVVHNPKRLGQRIYAGINLVLVTLGFLVGARHVWLQHLPADQVPECGPGLDYMLDVFPLSKTLKMVFSGSGECAEIQWQFLGLSIPEQTLLLFLALTALVLLQLFRKT
ncbi:MAG TPA: disulfide bond formation protein B [Acidiferrobacteraceae bacterium]|nr:disulfide bond formation protein B [Acidiferrobacteraceae bacterium]